MRIALIATCLGDALFPEVAKATTLLLERLGHEVVFPPDQVCCGQMHVNTGYLKEAVPVKNSAISACHRWLTSVASIARCAAIRSSVST